ncbi:MAG: DUF2752 domain-containing protein [Lachnospiraceae bacterium]|jgi:FtsH-binding integral membrane protein|nr:DUF2752 domain-containing protein [Lachnospiraceae bacterium]
MLFVGASAKAVFGRLWADARKYWWVAVFLGAYYAVTRWLMPVSCPLYYSLGIPCAGCGMTRAVRFVLTLQFGRAFYLNPLAFVLVGFGLYCCFFRYVKGKAIPAFFPIIIVFFVLLALFYLVRMYLYFPDRVPYVYNHNNLMGRVVPGYREIILRVFGF